MNEEKLYKIALGLLISLLIEMLLLVIAIVELHEDYKCSTTINNDYYIKNNCERFER